MYGFKIFKNHSLDELSAELSNWLYNKKTEIISHTFFKENDMYIISIIYKY